MADNPKQQLAGVVPRIHELFDPLIDRFGPKGYSPNPPLRRELIDLQNSICQLVTSVLSDDAAERSE